MLRWYASASLPKLRWGFSVTHVVIRYQARLAARPLLTQSITTAILFATGDVTAQQLVEKRGIAGHDVARTGRMTLYGGSEFCVPPTYDQRH